MTTTTAPRSGHTLRTWTPARRILMLRDRYGAASYRVTEFDCDWPGRAFRLDKLAGGTDGANANYSCLIADRDSVCDCRGFTSVGHCKHLDALAALIEREMI